MSRNALITIAVVVVLLIGGWWLWSSQKAATTTIPQSTPSATQSSEPATSSAEMGETREIKVSGTEFAFSPSNLSIKAGEKVKITFQNDGKLPHNLTIDELGIATKTISPGQSDTVEFTADRTGSYEMYCSVGNHRQQGMEGQVQLQ